MNCHKPKYDVQPTVTVRLGFEKMLLSKLEHHRSKGYNNLIDLIVSKLIGLSQIFCLPPLMIGTALGVPHKKVLADGDRKRCSGGGGP